MSSNTGARREGWTARMWSSFRERIDWALARSPLWIIVWLAVAAFGIAVFAAGVISLFGLGAEPGFGPSFWDSLIRTIDPGQIAEDRGAFALVTLGITLLGLLLFSTLISLVNTQFDRRVESVRRGRDRVAHPGKHFVILGWTDLTLKVAKELHDSGGSEQPPTVVVMAPEPWTELHELADEFARDSNVQGRRTVPWGRSWLQVRTGNPSDPRDLRNIALVAEARAVIVLAATGHAGHPSRVPPAPDARPIPAHLGGSPQMTETAAATVTTIFALANAIRYPNGDGKKSDAAGPTIVAEIADPVDDSGSIGDRLVERIKVLGLELVTADVHKVQAGLAAQVCSRAGLSSIYQEILNFDGVELYLQELSQPDHRTFGEILLSKQPVTPVGLASRSRPEPGAEYGPLEVDMWPDWNTSVRPDSADGTESQVSLVVLAESQAECKRSIDGRVTNEPATDLHLTKRRDPPARSGNDRYLVLGWNRRAPMFLRAMGDHDSNLALTVVTSSLDVDLDGGDVTVIPTSSAGGLQGWIHDSAKAWIEAPTASAATCHVIVLANDDVTASASDADVLMSALALSEFRTSRKLTLAAELRERQNKYLSKLVVDDQIIGDSVLAHLLAQYAVQPQMKEVFTHLLGSQPVEIDLLDSADVWAEPGSRMWSEVVERVARDRGEIAIGIRRDNNSRSVELNPSMNDTVELGNGVRLVVVTRRPAVASAVISPADRTHRRSATRSDVV